MKRPSSTGSLVGAGDGGLLQVCACSPEEKRAFARVGSFHSILDGLGEEEEDEMMMIGGEGGRVGLSLSSAEKKRRLSIDQVKALEKNFEMENKLQPERKAKLAQELGLQPRQVAVWFQNRRARWKTKQIERDYCILKANYDALKSNYDALVHDKESLLAEFKELKLKLAGDGESSYCSIKEEPVVGEEEKQVPTPQKTSITATAATTGISGGLQEQDEEDAPPLIYKDGPSDSDSSAILNDFSSPSRVVQSHQKQLQDEFTGFNYTSSSTSSPFQYHDGGGNGLTYHYYQHQEDEKQAMLMMDETEFGPCSSGFFSDEQPSSLTWYCPHQWD